MPVYEKKAPGALVIGGAGSGKSAYAESLCLAACALGAPAPRAVYLATMPGEGADAARRIERHRRLRAGKGFLTVECPYLLEASSSENLAQARGRTVLLECLGTLTANELFRPEPPQDDAAREVLAACDWREAQGACAACERSEGNRASAALARVLAGVASWMEAAREVVVVSNDVFADGVRYDEETERYRRVLATANRVVAARCSRVVEVVCGIPVPLKGAEA